MWAWKGDYLNLGAGAELGVYKRWIYDTDLWTVDKKAALPMTLKLVRYGETIINWKPEAKQWWITGFNSKYHISRSELSNMTATFEVTFVTLSYSSSFDTAFLKGFEAKNTNKSYVKKVPGYSNKYTITI